METHAQWELRMIRERGWIYIEPRPPALWRVIVRRIVGFIRGED